MRLRRPSSDARTTPAVTVLRTQVQPSGPLYTCTACRQAKPSEAYARWGLGGTRFGSFCGVDSACDACLDEITRFPADMPLPVTLIEVLRQSDGAAVWKLTA
jgi:hypothetical protein